MATTALCPNALPGPPRTFSPKASLAAQITQLWAAALPGPLHAFTAKSAAEVSIGMRTAGAGQGRQKPKRERRPKRALPDDELILLV